MEPWLIGAIAGGTAALAVMVSARRGNKTALEVLPLLRDRGPLTIPEIMEQLGLVGFSAQGKVVMALDSLIRAGSVEERPVPPGTPQLEKIKVRKYALRAS
jgi:predicted transcriptional regulator